VVESSLYPPSPQTVPADLTSVDRRYRVQVFLVLVHLASFALLYLALLGGSGYLVYRSILMLVHSPRDLALGLPALGGSVLVFLFLSAPLFRRSQVDRSLQLEVTAETQPDLFAFIGRLCDELRAPRPRRVLLSPEVNAAVVGSTSLFHLIVPGRQDLLIGLGLVNVLNLTEFKAVLAHEFGHFSQKGLRVGSYVYVAARIITDMVRGSRRVDLGLRRLTPIAEGALQVIRVDVRLALFVLPVLVLLYLLIGVMKGFAGILTWLNRHLGLSNLSLMRQMEFSADLAAVSVTGSDAPVDVLVRLIAADNAQSLVVRDLAAAADAGLHTRDLFYHQTSALAFLRRLSGNPDLGVPPRAAAGGTGRANVFSPEETTVPKMWATHPSNYEREQNAKRRYVAGVQDDRPAWLVFRDAASLRERLTRRVYQHLLERAAPPAAGEPQVVQAFIDQEHADCSFDPRYAGVYDDRYVEPGNPDELVELCRSYFDSDDELDRARTELLSPSVREAASEHHGRLAEAEALGRVDDSAEFDFRGQKQPPGNARRLHTEVTRELAQFRQRLAKFDRDVFLAHYAMANRLADGSVLDLVDRYRFHLGIQNALAVVTDRREWFHAVIYFLSGREQINEQEFDTITAGARSLHRTLAACIEDLERLKVPALKYVAPGRTARDLLLKDLTLERFRIADRALKPRYLVQSFVNTAESLSAVRDRTHRLHFKSLSAILALQDDIQAHWSNRQSAPAAGEKLAGGVCPGASDGVSFSAEAHPT
jgi:Zn-dependent protease with chaperone function